MTRARWPMVDLYNSFSNLAAESGAVVGLRMLRAIEGGPTWPAEMTLMVEEKARAAVEVQSMFFTSLLTGRSATAPSRALAMYRRKVKSNRRRLTGKP